MTQDDKYVLITGAAGGIGRALVTEFANNGFKVIATDCVPMPVGLAAHHYIQADLAKTVEDEIYAKNIFSQINDWIGPNALHALVNNAAVQILGGVDSLSRKDWQQTLSINLVAPFIWTQALLHHLEKVRGSVVNISSIHAKLTKKNFVAYATSKAALSGMTRALAVDVGPRIRVNAIEPAAIDTKMLRSGFENNQIALKALCDCHPTLSIGNPKEVAEIAIMLTKETYKFMSGSCFQINGGIESRLYDPN